jgi:hypothetical protein
VAVLRQYAPSWLVHLPALFALEDRERLAPLVSGVTPARMLRELAEALEVLTVTRPLVLVLEDLHWSDRATIEWLAYVVRRRDRARLLILGTYRPVEVIVHAPALRSIKNARGTPPFRAGRKGRGPAGATAEPSGGVEAPAFTERPVF